MACVFVLDLNSCVKTRTGTWALTLQKRVGGEQVHEDYEYNVHKMDQLPYYPTYNMCLYYIIKFCFLSSPEHLK